MTQAEIEIHKEKIKKSMVDHLTSIGYPNIPDELIMRELKPMWLKLEEAGLILPGMTFQHFTGYANNEFILSQVRGIMGI